VTLGDGDDQPRGHVVDLDELEHGAHSHEFVGADHGAIPFSVILVHSAPGVGPKLHQHPYPEVFIVEAGEATFRIAERTLVVSAGHVVVSPANEAHGFTNTGGDELRLTSIHGASRFDTEWLEGDDDVWRSRPANSSAGASGPRGPVDASRGPDGRRPLAE
jgi:mannose-6-phosphate isomerase-like protein (cupin superfamily)